MAFEDKYRLSAHAVITNDKGQVLQLKQTYSDKRWGLPGGALEPNETIHEAVLRECQEELGTRINVIHLSGVYYHAFYESHVFIFKAELEPNAQLKLSSEHSDYHYFDLGELSDIQQIRVKDCLEFDGKVQSRKF